MSKIIINREQAEAVNRFRVGDLIIDKNDNYRTVIKINEIETFHLFGNWCDEHGQETGTCIKIEDARNATESEIAAEKERRMGSKLDKILLDSSYTLNQEQAYKDLQEEKRLVEEECERYKKMFSEEKGKSIALYNQNKCYEQALEFGIKYLQASNIGQIQLVVQAMEEALGE